MSSSSSTKDFPLSQQARLLQTGCAEFLRLAEPRLTVRETEKLSHSAWLARRQIELAAQPDHPLAVANALENALNAMAALRLRLVELSHRASLNDFVPLLARQISQTLFCENQLREWIDHIRHPEQPMPDQARSALEREWNSAFADLIRIEQPPSPRRTETVPDSPAS